LNGPLGLLRLAAVRATVVVVDVGAMRALHDDLLVVVVVELVDVYVHDVVHQRERRVVHHVGMSNVNLGLTTPIKC